jgi:hypothetical protein
MPLLATALICTALSTGCAASPAAPAAHAASEPPAAPAAHTARGRVAAPTASAASRPASHFAIAFERSGGPKARVETLVVCPGLRAYATAPKGDREASAHFRMSASTAEELRREFAKARFTHLESTANPATCADCYVYSITYHGHTVLFYASKVPPGLLEVVGALEEEVIEHLYRHVGYLRA